MKFDIRIEQTSHPDLSCFFIWFQRPRYAGLLTNALSPSAGK